MPWELRASPLGPRGSLGTIAEVQAALATAVPGIALFRDASGPEKIKAMEEAGIEVPDVIREHLSKGRGAFKGIVEGSEFSIEFNLGDDETAVDSILIDVRGNGNPMDVLERMMAIPNWQVLDAAGTPPSRQGFESFATWRDEAIEQLE